MKSPDISFLKIFGTDAYVHVYDTNRRKLDYQRKKFLWLFNFIQSISSLDSGWSQNGYFKGCNNSVCQWYDICSGSIKFRWRESAREKTFLGSNLMWMKETSNGTFKSKQNNVIIDIVSINPSIQNICIKYLIYGRKILAN